MVIVFWSTNRPKRFCIGMRLVVSLWWSSTVIHSCVFRLQILALQGDCVTGGVSGDTELVFQWVFICCATTSPYYIDPLQGFSCCLSNPCCVIASQRIRDFAVDGQLLSWLDYHWSWLCKFISLNTCWTKKKPKKVTADTYYSVYSMSKIALCHVYLCSSLQIWQWHTYHIEPPKAADMKETWCTTDVNGSVTIWSSLLFRAQERLKDHSHSDVFVL